MSYYVDQNGTPKKVLSVVEVKEVEVDYYVGCATYDTTKEDNFFVPNYLSVNGANFPILDNTKTSVFEIGGNSVSFNQLIVDAFLTSATSYWTRNRLSQTNNNGVATFVVTNNTYNYVSFYHVFSAGDLIKGHKYLAKVKVRKTSGNANGFSFDWHGTHTININNPTLNEWYELTNIFTQTRENTEATNGMDVSMKYANTSDIIINSDSFEAKEPQLFDLTLMGLENITIEQFKSLFPLDYYEYQENNIKATILSKIESWGFNIWDEEWQRGSIDNNGQIISSSTYCVSKNLQRIIQNKQYYLRKNSGYNLWFYWYDKDGNYLPPYSSPFSTEGRIVTPPSNACYFRILWVGTTYNHDICINRSSALNGTYKPYVGKLGQINLPNAPITLNGVNNIHDLLTFEEQEDGTYNAILTRNIREEDFGRLDWAYNSSLSAYVSGGLANVIKRPNNDNEIVNILSVKYKPTARSSTHENNDIYAISSNGNICVYDNNESETPSGKVQYQLATPTTETIATGLTFDQVATLFEKCGTIQLDNENTDYIQANLSMAFAIRRFRSEEQ